MWILKTFKRILTWFWLLLALPHVLMWRISPARPIIEQDLKRWVEHGPKRVNLREFPEWKQFAWLIWKIPTFRNLLYYRIGREVHWPSRVLLEITKRIYRRWPSLWIAASAIGPGLFIQHGYSTAIGGKRIGSNCWINQEVTIGHLRNEDEGPVIGDNVRIAAGAKVLGNITIGDNCKIAPNSFVNRNVPPNCTVIGVPARIVKRDGKPIWSSSGTRPEQT
ncbi:serine O-acetyltransferase [soil metagenome]